jgi:WD40 repeat protein
MANHVGYIEGFVNAVDGIRYLKALDICVASCRDGSFILWHPPLGSPKHTETFLPEGDISFPVARWLLDAFPDGSHVLVACQDSAEILAVPSFRHVVGLNGNKRRILAGTVSSDGRIVVTGGEDKCLSLWDSGTGRQIGQLHGHNDEVFAISWASHGMRLASASYDGEVKIWNPFTRTCESTLSLHDPVLSLAFHPGGRFLLAGHTSGFLRLLDTTAGRVVLEIPAHVQAIKSVSFSHDGFHALTGSYDRLCKLWIFEWVCDSSKQLSDWDVGARPFLEQFLTLHSPYRTETPNEADVTLLLQRKVKPSWEEDDFGELLIVLASAGYGWLRPEGVRRQLEKMAAHWQGPPKMPWEEEP